MFWCHVTIVSLESKLDVLGPKIESCDVQVSAARIFSGSLNLLGVLDPVLPVICNLADVMKMNSHVDPCNHVVQLIESNSN
jgi:hypothetical protein